MRIVGVVRTLNEDDIIEAVLRHHLALMDAVIVLDDGSNDQTTEIVSALRDEGLNIELIKRRCVIFDEGNRNTFLYLIATVHYSADWVVFFDADEFIDLGRASVSLKSYLRAVPSNYEGVTVKMVNYIDSVEDNHDEVSVPKRMVWRHIVPHEVYKVMVRALSAPESITIHAGNHMAYRGGQPLNLFASDDVLLAHYPRRSGWHNIYKVVIGRLKITAAGSRETKKYTGAHYIPEFEMLLNQPEVLIGNKSYFSQSPNRELMVNSPIVYLGGDLRYTRSTDYKSKCISMVLKYAKELATEYGYLMDNNAEVQRRVAKTLELEYGQGGSAVMPAQAVAAVEKNLNEISADASRVAALHPHWSGSLLLSSIDSSVVHEKSGNRGTYCLSEGTLTINWEKFGRECFFDVRGTYVHEQFLKDVPDVSKIFAVTLWNKNLVATKINVVIPEVNYEVCLRLRSSDVPTFAQVFVNRDYDSESIPGGAKTIVDLGANIGLATVFFGTRYPEAEILAVEPDDNNFGMLAFNTLALGSRVRIERAAVWTHDGSVSLHAEDEEGRSLEDWGLQVSDTSNRNGKRVPCHKLSTLIDRTGWERIDILKVDVEGAELELFSNGALEWLSKVDFIFVETHDRFRPGSENAVRSAVASTFVELPSSGENLLFRRR